jgi:hypothetical protein
MIFRLQTNADYVSGRDSYLTFGLAVQTDVSPTSALRVHFGRGSIVNIIDEIIVRSRDGTEISHVRDVGLLHHQKSAYMRAPDWHKTYGSVMGFTNGFEDESQTVNQNADYESENSLSASMASTTGNTVRQFCIPLREIIPLFDIQKMLPAPLMAGCQLEIVLNNRLNEAFVCSGAINVQGYSVSKPDIRCQTCTLSDSIVSVLSDSASQEGLKLLVDCEFDSTHAFVSNGTEMNVQLRRNVSQLNATYVRTRDASAINDKSVDSYASQAYPASGYSYQIRHGSIYYPSARVDTDAEAYLMTQISAGKSRNDEAENRVSLGSFKTRDFSVIHSTERSPEMLSLSGLAVSNSKLYEFSSKYSSAQTIRTDIHYKYSQLVSVFLTNVLVES